MATQLIIDGVTVYDSATPTPTPVPTPVPTPTPVPSAGGSMDRPTNESQLNDALQSAAAEGRVCLLDPRVTIAMTKTITVLAKGSGTPWGVDGNYARLIWQGPAGYDMLVYQGVKGINDRALTIQRLSMDGNGYAALPAASCLKLSAPAGDGPLYKFLVRDIYSGWGDRGIVLEGAVFEGFLENVHAENCRSHGMETLHLPGAIISNINIVHPNLSRNFGAGLKCTYSTNLMFGSFILNAQGAVIAPDGIRYAAACNGENSGEAMFVVPANGYGSVITGCEASSDGVTVARQFQNGAWVNIGKPMLYLLDGAAGVTQRDCHTSYYGAAPDPMRLLK